MTGLAHDLRTVAVLVGRDVRLFFRQKGRVLGAIAQPVLFWLAFGAGMAPTFRAGEEGPGYMTFLFPGIVLMLVLFASISSTMSVIEDRHQGFLQGVLAGPGSRGAVALGKSLGSTTVAMLQAALLLLLAPLAGFPYAEITWLPLAAGLALLGLALGALGFALAWRLDSSAAYHAVMGIVLVPAWMLSGALFPAEGLHPVLGAIVRWNPLGHGLATVRRALQGEGAGAAAWGIVSIFAALCLGVAAFVASRRRGA